MKLIPAVSAFGAWFKFAATHCGAFYAFMNLSLITHELLGHGLANVICGSREIRFAVRPGFSGWASGGGVNSAAAAYFVQYAGIGVNAIAGVAVLSIVFRFRRPALTQKGVALFWLAVTETGHAVGYLLQGALFGQGDARGLSRVTGWLRVSVIVLLAAAMLLLAHWAITTLAGFAREHFGARSRWELIKVLGLGFALPVSSIVLAAGGLPGRTWWTRLVFDGAVIGLVVLGSIWAAWRAPAAPVDRASEGRRLSWPGTAAWSAIGLAAFTLTSFWLSKGVRISLG